MKNGDFGFLVGGRRSATDAAGPLRIQERDLRPRQTTRNVDRRGQVRPQFTGTNKRMRDTVIRDPFNSGGKLETSISRRLSSAIRPSVSSPDDSRPADRQKHKQTP